MITHQQLMPFQLGSQKLMKEWCNSFICYVNEEMEGGKAFSKRGVMVEKIGINQSHYSANPIIQKRSTY